MKRKASSLFKKKKRKATTTKTLKLSNVTKLQSQQTHVGRSGNKRDSHALAHMVERVWASEGTRAWI